MTWLEWSVQNAWPEHSRRLDGLVNAEFVAETARVVGGPTSDIEKLAKRSTDPSWLRELTRHSGSPELALLKDAYLTSALIRGKYHELVAGKSQLFRHRCAPDLLRPGGCLPRNGRSTTSRARFSQMLSGTGARRTGSRRGSQSVCRLVTQQCTAG